MKHCKSHDKYNDCKILNCRINCVSQCYFSEDRTDILNETEVYLKTQNPREYIKYKNYTRKANIPNIGDIVVAITNGFACGSEGGTVMKVVAHDEKGFILEREGGRRSWCDIEHWWKQVVIIKEKKNDNERNV